MKLTTRRASLARALVVDSIEDKLAKALPGAKLHQVRNAPPSEIWEVRMPNRVIKAVAASRREAVDRAIFLWGSR